MARNEASVVETWDQRGVKDTADVLQTETRSENRSFPRTLLKSVFPAICILILFLNYFLAQFDKFVLSYFQNSLITSLNLTSTEYGTLSGYATGIVYACLALPIAFIADYLPSARVWVLFVASMWWSLCVIFQGLAQAFWQILLARIGMGIGQSAVEALSVSIISDLIGERRNVFIGGSAFYVGVYIGEAISGQIATAFTASHQDWRVAMKAIGITGIVFSLLLRAIVRDPARRARLMHQPGDDDALFATPVHDDLLPRGSPPRRLALAKANLLDTMRHIMRMRSFWLLTLSASFRQLSGNVFGFYMPSYLSSIYPDTSDVLSRYGIIVGVAGSVSVLGGGFLTAALWKTTKLTPIYLVSIGGMMSSAFVLVMIFSRRLAGGDQQSGTRILYGSMTAAYLLAETWLGVINALVALLLPARFKTFGLAIWGSIQTLIYSSGPEIMGLALSGTDPTGPQYVDETRIALAVIIPVGYWVAGCGFIAAIPAVRQDLRHEIIQGRHPKHVRLRWQITLLLITLLVTALLIADIRQDVVH